MRNGRLIALLLVLVAMVPAIVAAAGCSEPLTTTTAAAGEHGTSAVSETTGPLPAPTDSAPAGTPSTQVTSSSTSAIPSDAAARLGRMTLQQKAAQVLLVSFAGTELTASTREMLARAAPAGVLLLGRNVSGREQLHSLTAALQETARDAGAPGLFIAADEEGGDVMRVRDGLPDVPSAHVLGTTSTPTAARALAEETAAGLVSQGVNMVLAPVADVVADRDSFLYSRSYGSTTELVSSFVAAVSQGYLEGGLVTVVKHFPGHGSAPENSHTSVPVASAARAEFEAVHLPPFAAAVSAGVDGVMVGHILVPAYDRLHPASQSRAIIEDLLRGELGFAGLVVSDDLEMAAAAGKPGGIGTATSDELGRAAVSALTAGCDLLITTGTYARQLAIEEAIVDGVRAGRLSEERLDEAVIRVLTAKEKHSL